MTSKITFFFILMALSVSSIAAGHPIVAIDPGHGPSKSGAQGTCGKSEVTYNDLTARDLKTTLAPSYFVLLTRQPGDEIKPTDSLFKEVTGVSKGLWTKNKNLIARPAIANAKHADAFISIHHDSVSKKHQLKFQELCDGKGGTTVSDVFRQRYKIGFNIFVHNEGKERNRRESIKLAKIIGRKMISMGRSPSNYHFYPVDDCKSCEPVDKQLGVWHHDLAVLRYAKMPAVLIEVGNIVDHEDEHRINNEAFRKTFSLNLKAALDEYLTSK